MAEDDELEYTLLNKREVMVYKIPPASSSSGHKADDWKECIWRGRLQVAGKGSSVSIKLLDASSGNLFAQCMIPEGDHEKYVERVMDSSRYFVLKISNGARHAFIGLGFEDRNDAFDFNCTLSDFKSTWVDRGKQAEESKPTSDEPAKDLSLKEGQKITINLGGLGLKGERRRDKQAESNGEGGGFIGLLAPPPPGGASRKAQAAAPAAAAPVAAAPVAAGKDDFFGADDFDDFQSSAPAAGGSPIAAPAPAFPAAMAPPVQAAAPAVNALTNQLGSLGFGASAADPFGASPVAPAATYSDPFANAPAPVNPNPASSFGDPFAPSAPMGAVGAAAPPMAPAAPPMGAAAPAPSGAFDPFNGFGSLGPATSAAAPAASPVQFGGGMGVGGGMAAPKPAGGKSDPFDEFDIFK